MEIQRPVKNRKPSDDYRADFLWPHEEGSIQEAGYEFANGLTEEYRQFWWGVLIGKFRKEAIEIVEKWIPMGLHNAPQEYQQEVKRKIISELEDLSFRLRNKPLVESENL